MAQNIRDMLKDLEKKQTSVTLAWMELEKSIQTSRELAILEEGVTFVTNWILGTAEALLNDQSKVGYDAKTSEQLRKDHDNLELQCVETYGFYAELLHKIEVLPIAKDSYSHSDLMSQKEFMDFVCRSFATRLERRRNLLITTSRFFRLVSQYFEKTSKAFDTMVLNNKSPPIEKAPAMLRNIEDTQNTLGEKFKCKWSRKMHISSFAANLEEDLIKEGEKLSDMLSMPVKDALGCEVTVDYRSEIMNVKDVMDATITRRNIFLDSLELQKVTLKHIIHIDSYETDLATSISWLKNLYEVFTKSHVHVGVGISELQHQKDDLESFFSTSKEIYGYGCHLLEASFSLRQLSKMNTDKCEEFGVELKSFWTKLQGVCQEQLTRLRVSTVFHRSIDDYMIRIRDITSQVTNSCEEDWDLVDLENHLKNRERTLIDVGRTVRLGRLLKTRLKEPLITEENR